MDDFFRHIRSFLGISKFDRSDFREDERSPNNFNDSRYDAFSDPLEMHRYFEDQMNKILRNFDIFEFGRNDSFFGDIPNSREGSSIFGALDQNPFNEDIPVGGELRDQFLKPGYEKPPQIELFDKTDRDLDENQLSIRDLDSVVTGKFNKKHEHPSVTSRFFGKSICTKTVMNPDGSIEIHKTVRDNEGNEETTVTRKIGNKEHSVIKKKDKSGKEEIIENLVNMDENDSSNLLSTPDNSKHTTWFLFDKFFK